MRRKTALVYARRRAIKAVENRGKTDLEKAATAAMREIDRILKSQCQDSCTELSKANHRILFVAVIMFVDYCALGALNPYLLLALTMLFVMARYNIGHNTKKFSHVSKLSDIMDAWRSLVRRNDFDVEMLVPEHLEMHQYIVSACAEMRTPDCEIPLSMEQLEKLSKKQLEKLSKKQLEKASKICETIQAMIESSGTKNDAELAAAVAVGAQAEAKPKPQPSPKLKPQPSPKLKPKAKPTAKAKAKAQAKPTAKAKAKAQAKPKAKAKAEAKPKAQAKAKVQAITRAVAQAIATATTTAEAQTTAAAAAEEAAVLAAAAAETSASMQAKKPVGGMRVSQQSDILSVMCSLLDEMLEIDKDVKLYQTGSSVICKTPEKHLERNPKSDVDFVFVSPYFRLPGELDAKAEDESKVRLSEFLRGRLNCTFGDSFKMNQGRGWLHFEVCISERERLDITCLQHWAPLLNLHQFIEITKDQTIYDYAREVARQKEILRGSEESKTIELLRPIASMHDGKALLKAYCVLLEKIGYFAEEEEKELDKLARTVSVQQSYERGRPVQSTPCQVDLQSLVFKERFLIWYREKEYSENNLAHLFNNVNSVLQSGMNRGVGADNPQASDGCQASKSSCMLCSQS